MAIFSNPQTNATNDSADLSYTHEGGTQELRNYVAGNIVSNSQDMDRITRYQLYWNFYNGKHWRVYNDTFLSFNYIKAFINKVNSFLLGKEGFGFNVVNEHDEVVDEQTESAAEAIINYVWKNNKKVQKQYEILQMGSVCGDVWVHLQWKEDSVFGESQLMIDCLDSRHCFPEFENGDTRNVSAFVLRQPLVKNNNNFKIFCTRYTKEKVQTWYQKDTNAKWEESVKYNTSEIDNPYGFIPVVHIKNKPKADEYYGVSDCIDILKINKIYTEQSQTIKEIVDYYTAPVTVVTGGTVRNLTKGVGRIWSGLPAEANVFNLTLGEDLMGSMAFLDRLKMAMHELSDVPENALGKLQPISNTSAAALQITYQPLIQQADSKAITYSEGFSLLHKMIFKILRKVSNDKKIIELLKVIGEDFEKYNNGILLQRRVGHVFSL